MKRTLLSLFLALTLALSLAACGGQPPSSPTDSAGQPGQTEGPDHPGEENTGGADSDEEDTNGSDKEDAAQADPVDLTAFYTALTENGEEWPAMMASEAEALEAFYPGLGAIETRQCLVQMAAISSVACEIALVETANAEDVQAVEAIFQARINYQVGDENNPGGAWYPETIAQWQENSRIVSNGTYVMLAVGEHADYATEQFQALFA